LWVIGIAILVFVFALGVKAGEFRDELRSAFGGYYRACPMMQYREYGGALPGSRPMPMEGNATGTLGATAPVGQ
jgi:hypothetical protein